MKSKCLVCLNARRELERFNNTFDIHITKHHDIIKYLEYLLYLRSRDSSTFKGIEYYVNSCLMKNNIEFFPGSNTRFLTEGRDSLKVENSETSLEKNIKEIVIIIDNSSELTTGKMRSNSFS